MKKVKLCIIIIVFIILIFLIFNFIRNNRIINNMKEMGRTTIKDLGQVEIVCKTNLDGADSSGTIEQEALILPDNISIFMKLFSVIVSQDNYYLIKISNDLQCYVNKDTGLIEKVYSINMNSLSTYEIEAVDNI